VATGEQELESLVGKYRLFQDVLGGFRDLEQAGLRGERAIAPDTVDRPVAGGRQEPRAGIGGQPVAAPALGNERERLLGGFLGEIEVAEEADQGRENPAPLAAEDPLENR
jgi:hypothetical protein